RRSGVWRTASPARRQRGQRGAAGLPAPGAARRATVAGASGDWQAAELRGPPARGSGRAAARAACVGAVPAAGPAAAPTGHSRAAAASLMSGSAPDFLWPDWPLAGRVHAAVTLRAGGVSRGPYQSLNLAAHVGDRPADVAENRRRVRAALSLPSEPLWLKQVHGTMVLDADARGVAGTEGDSADAAVTRRPGC